MFFLPVISLGKGLRYNSVQQDFRCLLIGSRKGLSLSLFNRWMQPFQGQFRETKCQVKKKSEEGKPFSETLQQTYLRSY